MVKGEDMIDLLIFLSILLLCTLIVCQKWKKDTLREQSCRDRPPRFFDFEDDRPEAKEVKMYPKREKRG